MGRRLPEAAGSETGGIKKFAAYKKRGSGVRPCFRAVCHRTGDDSAESVSAPVQKVIWCIHLLNIFITDLKQNLKFKQYLNF